MMPLKCKERDDDPEFTYRLLVVTLILDFLLAAWIMWKMVNLPLTDFATSSVQFHVLYGDWKFMILPLGILFFLAIGKPVVSIFYAILKFIRSLMLSASFYGQVLIGHKLSWFAYAQIGWSFYTVVIATIYFFLEFKFTASDTNLSSTKATLVEQIEELQILRANGTLSEERFKELEAKLVERAEKE